MESRTLCLFIVFSQLRQCTGVVCDEDKWFCIDYLPLTQCKPCERNYLSPTIGNELLNFINKFVCLSNIIQKPCVKGCIPPRTYCNAMYKSIPEGNFNVSLKMDISVKLVNRKHSQFLGAFGICEKLRRNPLCLFEAKVDAGTNFESLHICINVCSSGTCEPFKNSDCEYKFKVPFKHRIENQNTIGLVLTLDLSNHKAYICVTTESKQTIKEAKCIAQIDVLVGKVVFDLRRKFSQKELYFLIHHHDQMYFNFNSNYLSINSIYIYEDNLADRIKMPQVSKTIQRVNKLVSDLSQTGKGVCTNNNREFCAFPSKCIGGAQRCKILDTYQNTATAYFSYSQYVTFNHKGSVMLNSIAVAVNETKGSINILSANEEIIESIIVNDISNSKTKKILVYFNKHQHEFMFHESSSVLFTIKIQNVIGTNCYYDQSPIVYFANDHGVVALGTLSSSPTAWIGLFLDGFKQTLKVEETYIECASTTLMINYTLSILFIVLFLFITIGTIVFYKYKNRNIFIFLYTFFITNMCPNSLNSRSVVSNTYDVDFRQTDPSHNNSIVSLYSNSRTNELLESGNVSIRPITIVPNECVLLPMDVTSDEGDNISNRLKANDVTNNELIIAQEHEILTSIRNLYYE